MSQSEMMFTQKMDELKHKAMVKDLVYRKEDGWGNILGDSSLWKRVRLAAPADAPLAGVLCANTVSALSPCTG